MNKLSINQSIYDFCLLYQSKSFELVDLQIDDKLILAHNSFASADKKIKSTKIMIKICDQLAFIKSIKSKETVTMIVSFDVIKLNQESLIVVGWRPH